MKPYRKNARDTDYYNLLKTNFRNFNLSYKIPSDVHSWIEGTKQNSQSGVALKIIFYMDIHLMHQKVQTKKEKSSYFFKVFLHFYANPEEFVIMQGFPEIKT